MGTVARGTRGLSIRGAAHTCVSGAVDAILITQGSLALTSLASPPVPVRRWLRYVLFFWIMYKIYIFM